MFTPSTGGLISLRPGKTLTHAIIVKAVGGRTPVPSGQSGSSKSSSSTGRTGQEKLKRDCLRRDNNRCMITNGYDTVKAAQLPESEQNALTLRFPTHCSHIFPYSSGPTVADGQVDGGDVSELSLLHLPRAIKG